MRCGRCHTAEKLELQQPAGYEAGGIDILKLTPGAKAAKAAKREVVAPAQSAAQRSFLAKMSTKLKPDLATAGLCLLQT